MGLGGTWLLASRRNSARRSGLLVAASSLNAEVRSFSLDQGWSGCSTWNICGCWNAVGVNVPRGTILNSGLACVGYAPCSTWNIRPRSERPASRKRPPELRGSATKRRISTGGDGAPREGAVFSTGKDALAHRREQRPPCSADTVRGRFFSSLGSCAHARILPHLPPHLS